MLTEARRNSVILVDFQESYSNARHYDKAIESAIRYINKYQPSVTAFYNGSDVGIEDTKEDVGYHYLEYGLEEELLSLFTFKEKSYAWLRTWMDEGIDPSFIIKTIRYLVMNDMRDSRDIEPEVLKQLVDNEFDDWMYDDGIYLPDISIGDLKQLDGSLIGGGGEHECLRELQLFMNAFNIKYKSVRKWIYG